jgi:hypothetical protein
MRGKRSLDELTEITTLNPVTFSTHENPVGPVNINIYVHEVLDDAVELGAFVAEAKLSAILLDAGCQSTEVLRRFWDGLRNIIRGEALGTSKKTDTTYTTKEAQLDCQKLSTGIRKGRREKCERNALRPISLSPCLMSKYIIFVILGPRAASTDGAHKRAASVTTTKTSEALAKNILG